MHVSNQPMWNVRCVPVRPFRLEMTNAKMLSVIYRNSCVHNENAHQTAQARADTESLTLTKTIIAQFSVYE